MGSEEYVGMIGNEESGWVGEYLDHHDHLIP